MIYHFDTMGIDKNVTLATPLQGDYARYALFRERSLAWVHPGDYDLHPTFCADQPLLSPFSFVMSDRYYSYQRKGISDFLAKFLYELKKSEEDIKFLDSRWIDPRYFPKQIRGITFATLPDLLDEPPEIFDPFFWVMRPKFDALALKILRKLASKMTVCERITGIRDEPNPSILFCKKNGHYQSFGWLNYIPLETVKIDTDLKIPFSRTTWTEAGVDAGGQFKIGTDQTMDAYAVQTHWDYDLYVYASPPPQEGARFDDMGTGWKEGINLVCKVNKSNTVNPPEYDDDPTDDVDLSQPTEYKIPNSNIPDHCPYDTPFKATWPTDGGINHMDSGVVVTRVFCDFRNGFDFV